MLNEYLDLGDEVAKALESRRPVVALESTIISHGMPYPENLRTALRAQEIIRENGAAPATVAILDGRLKAGLSDEEIERLARAKDVTKVSRRDMPSVVALGLNGATTVAATMIVAAMAKIRIFATGGIGGVHRGASETFDISADLDELAMTGVAVVCSGAKSILDLPLTMEYLETKGVPVIGYRTDELPAFYVRKSGLKVDCCAESPEKIAAILRAKWGMGLSGGAVVANPIPEEDEMDGAVIDTAIKATLAEALAKGVKGKETTPFLLDRIREITGGDSLASNVKLVFSNAALAARIAAELAARK